MLAPRTRVTGGLLLPALLLFSGCATPALDSARSHFYQGRVKQAEADLAGGAAPDKDRVLLLMERGMIRQMRGAYEESTRDFLAAARRIDELHTYSISKGTASMVVNDTVQDFSGTPFEGTLLHAFTAKNYLAQGNWDEAAVEARLIIRSLAPETRGDYPDDAYSRYMAGLSLEMIDDDSNAAVQYRRAAELLSTVAIDDLTGRLSVKTTNTVYAAAVAASSQRPSELVCFVLSGQALSGARPRARHTHWQDTPASHAEILHRGTRLGRSFTLADTFDLAFTTQQVEGARKAVKTIARVAIKEGIAGAIEKDNEALGELVRFVLIGLLEDPDLRRWETLPRWLGVARVPCPPDLTEFDVVFKTDAGTTLQTIHVTQPIRRHRNTFVSFCRDIVPVE
jgi:hypothetical protein